MPAPRVEIRFSGTRDGFALGFARLRDALDASRVPEGPRYNAELVFEEIVANIVRHSATGGRAAEVKVTLESGAGGIVLTFEDDGIAFDPRGRTEVPTARSLEEAKAGGFGLMLVRRAAHSLDYLRTAEGRNRLTVTVR